ncbi:MAG TPA: hypothetical protein VF595_07690 [Tepidisphaeraceae bacterium]
MRTTLLKFVLPCLLTAAALPASAANGVADEEELNDGRLHGYTATGGAVGVLKITPPAGTAGTTFLTVGLGILCIGVMCKNGKRTHLD